MGDEPRRAAVPGRDRLRSGTAAIVFPGVGESGGPRQERGSRSGVRLRVVAGRLFLWSTACDEWVGCPPDEVTWLDRSTLSDNEDLTLHRAPRCAGLRHVQHRWELFSRDATYQVYLAPDTAGAPLSAEVVRRTARHVLPAAPESYEARPEVLAQGLWVVSVAAWVLRLRLDMPAEAGVDAADPDGDH